VTKPSSRRLLIWTTVLVAMLVVIAGSASRQTTAPIPLPPPQTASAASVVQGRLPANKIIHAREGQVVRIDVQSVTPDVAQIFSLGVSSPVGPGIETPLEFIADQPGRFNVTLRYSGELVGRVVVAPSSSG
jgi:hypothetical protein